LDAATIAKFQRELGAMGYKFQFITLAGFHQVNFGMFELARKYRELGMTAYAELQDAEFESEKLYGYRAVKHQAFVGTGYFDALQTTITQGTAATVALKHSTEAEQFNTANGGNGDHKGNGTTPVAKPDPIPNPQPESLS
jgi:isocitrate lyase